MNNYFKRPKTNKSESNEVTINLSFPKNCAEILAEFFAEYKLQSPDEKTDEEKSKKEKISTDLPLDATKIKQLKEKLIEKISYGLHGSVE